MRAALHFGDDRTHIFLVEIEHRDPRAGRAEGQRNFAADAAGASGDQDALSLEAGGQIPGHDISASGGSNPAGSST